MIWSKNEFEKELEDGTIYKQSATFKSWTFGGALHRMDGPALIWADGVSMWYSHGFNITENIKSWASTMEIDLENLTKEDILLITIKYG